MAKAPGIVGEFAKHSNQLPGVKRRQPSLENGSTRVVIEAGEKSQRRVVHLDDAISMPREVPLAFLAFDAATDAGPITRKTGVHGGWVKEVADVLYTHAAFRAVDIYAIPLAVSKVCEELQLILKLAMGPEPGIDRLAEYAALWIIIDALGVQEALNTSRTSHHPRLRQKALVGVGLCPQE